MSGRKTSVLSVRTTIVAYTARCVEAQNAVVKFRVGLVTFTHTLVTF